MPTKPLNFSDDRPEQKLVLAFAPMVDIVLLLICFYLFVSKAFDDFEDPSVNLPVITSELAADRSSAELVINLREDGGVTINGELVTLESLASILAGELREAKDAGERLNVVVRADRAQQFDRLGSILDVCRRAGVDPVLLRAVNEP